MNGRLTSSVSFPPLEQALKEPNGLLAVGGDLSPQRLLAAYRNGIFPWFNEGEPILWWSPDPRMTLFPNELKVSRSLSKELKKKIIKFALIIASVKSCRLVQRRAKVKPEHGFILK